jgi:hypothetical protein
MIYMKPLYPIFEHTQTLNHSLNKRSIIRKNLFLKLKVEKEDDSIMLI